MDGADEAVATLGHEDDSVVRCLLHAIDGMLERVGVIGLAVALGAKIVPGEINGVGIIGPHRISGLCAGD